ncbi:hypothetical protein PH213_20640 [Streptomyces sp. SRF1]|uniref:hypothetical protein n=1 Tax=Streptomyces sp. SRF1 TaxID=1549642 RepID=UPI0025AF937B|nr:hypothetical protein [Streptomyces sp. SRF1]MDN3056915.1 hypothetical protein [Streptomyces sp. SRF1]
MTIIEPFGPQYARPAAQDCPDCPCCTAQLCERGRTSVTRCCGLTDPERRDIVYACPCSAATTRGTHAWRAERIRVTRYATEHPLPPEVGVMLRALADGEPADDAQALARLRVAGFAAETDWGHVVTELGYLYLATRYDHRYTTPVEVLSVDTQARSAAVIVVGWRFQTPVTVLLDQLIAHTGLCAEELPGTWLEAEANCLAEHADDVVLTRIRIAPPLPDHWAEETATLVPAPLGTVPLAPADHGQGPTQPGCAAGAPAPAPADGDTVGGDA